MEPLSDPGVSRRWRYSARMLAALQVAAQLHASQVRKQTTIPYLSHLLGTCSIALDHGADEDQAIAALLHDAIEDVRPTETTRAAIAAFGDEVLRLVEALTDSDEYPKPPWRERKERYLQHLRARDGAVLLVSASDKLHNARSILLDLRRHGDGVWARFNASREDTLWYYRSLVTTYRANPAHDPYLVDELDRVVTEIEAFRTG